MSFRPKLQRPVLIHVIPKHRRNHETFRQSLQTPIIIRSSRVYIEAAAVCDAHADVVIKNDRRRWRAYNILHFIYIYICIRAACTIEDGRDEIIDTVSRGSVDNAGAKLYTDVRRASSRFQMVFYFQIVISI